MNVGLLDHNESGYKWLFGAGSDSFDKDYDVVWGFSNLTGSGYKDFPLIEGIINNNKIDKITVNNDPAKILSEGLGGRRIFYTLVNKDEDTPDIKGYDKNGKLIYKYSN